MRLFPVWRTLVHGAHIQRRQAASSSSGHTISSHAGHRSLCVCQLLASSGSPPRVMPSSFTAAALLPFRLLSPLHTSAWRTTGRIPPSSHPHRLHAHAAHRVPIPRADRPPCRPHTGTRPSYSCSLSVMLESPPLRHSYLELLWFQISVHQRFLDPSQESVQCCGGGERSTVSPWLDARRSSCRHPETHAATTALHLLS
jgi:hypothetical protein